jgi:hypothetical protein
MSTKPSKNSRVVRQQGKNVAVAPPIPKNKLPFCLFKRKPGRPQKPCGYYATREEAEAAQKHFDFETSVGSWNSEPATRR